MWEIITWNIKLRNHIALTSVKLNHITISIVWNTYIKIIRMMVIIVWNIYTNYLSLSQVVIFGILLWYYDDIKCIYARAIKHRCCTLFQLGLGLSVTGNFVRSRFLATGLVTNELRLSICSPLGVWVCNWPAFMHRDQANLVLQLPNRGVYLMHLVPGTLHFSNEGIPPAHPTVEMKDSGSTIVDPPGGSNTVYGGILAVRFLFPFRLFARQFSALIICTSA